MILQGEKLEGQIMTKLRQDFEIMETELEQVERQVCTEQDCVKIFRLQIDEGLDEALKGLEDLKAQLPKEQNVALFDQCTENALNAIVGHFGLGAVVLNAKDGGNVHTTHNVRKGIYANDTERQRYENRGEYDSDKYHQDSAYKEINKRQSALKKEGKLTDYMTGKKIKPNDNTDLDHIVAAKTIHDDPARVLAEVDGTKLANTESNLKMTDSALNRSKKDKSAQEFLQRRDENIAKLEALEAKRGYLTESEQNEMKKLQKQKEIDDEKLSKEYGDSKKQIDKKVDKAYYGSSKPYKEALKTGLNDAKNIAIHSAIGMVFKELIEGINIELKILFKEFGNESLKDIFKRFKQRISKIWADIQSKWKEIIAGSLESAIMAFFSNFIIFVVNIIFTTLKSIVRIIRAGFTSLYQAVKIIVNPPKDMPKEDVMFEASKVFVSGLIGAIAMLSSEAIKTWLLSIPGLNAVLILPVPFTDKTIGDTLSLCISAAMGVVLSTIAIYYMDKYASKEKERRIQIQIMAQSGVVVQYNIAQTWFCLYDAYAYFNKAVQESTIMLENAKEQIELSSTMAKDSINEAKNATNELLEFMYQQDMNKIRNNRG